MARTLIFCRENAQLGNRLIVYAHLLAAARERGWNLINPTFEPYADWFEGTVSRPHGRSLLAVRLAWQLGKVTAILSGGLIARARARGDIHVDLEAVVPAAELQRARWLLLQGFKIRCPTWSSHQAAGLREFFRPIKTYRQPAEGGIADLRSRADVVVGIHVRQGDYAQHLGGRYFYSCAQYAHFMSCMREQLAPRSVAFVVCTHVPLNHADFAGFTWALGPGNTAADLHALSLCDYIVGPPSSFSAWAAFHGATRLAHVRSAQQQLALTDFLIPTHPDIRD